jgi:thiol-disulfide isomerase/thioredoxin
MRKLLFLYTLLIALGVQAQGSISGNFAPPKNFKWLIAYELTPGGENYVTDTAVKDGHFSIKMPASAQPGLYRLVYAVPQDQYFIDLIYNKKEDIQFNFNLAEGITITNSEENKWFNAYFDAIHDAENKLNDFYESGSTSKDAFMEIIKAIEDIQDTYESEHEDTMAHEFIVANRGYLPESHQTASEFLKNKKKLYFEHLDFNNRTLLSSGFITDKISNYVFSAIPTTISSKTTLNSEVTKNVQTVHQKINETPDVFQVKVLHQLWKVANANSLTEVADYIFDTYLKNLANTTGNQKMVTEIESLNRLRIGALSPNITWTEKGKTRTLSSMEPADCYVIVFWSSTCSHCLKEVPELHKALQNFKNVKVLAMGLEDEEANWKKVSATLPNFTHGISLEKWDSEYVTTFNIQKTPTYFILDSEKHIIAKPDSEQEVVEFLKN